jgi:F0F1-type ATP synthase delta subunit
VSTTAGLGLERVGNSSRGPAQQPPAANSADISTEANLTKSSLSPLKIKISQQFTVGVTVEHLISPMIIGG